MPRARAAPPIAPGQNAARHALLNRTENQAANTPSMRESKRKMTIWRCHSVQVAHGCGADSARAMVENKKNAAAVDRKSASQRLQTFSPSHKKAGNNK